MLLELLQNPPDSLVKPIDGSVVICKLGASTRVVGQPRWDLDLLRYDTQHLGLGIEFQVISETTSGLISMRIDETNSQVEGLIPGLGSVKERFGALLEPHGISPGFIVPHRPGIRVVISHMDLTDDPLQS